MTPDAPVSLSVILASPGGFPGLATTVAHLRRQTVVDRIELVLVGPAAAHPPIPAQALQGFALVTPVSLAGRFSIGAANAEGVRRASASVVAFGEDHCFPEPGWAAALLAAHADGSASVVGPVVRNGNPQTMVSMADFLIGYGPWMEPASRARMPFLPGHNSSYRRADLLALGAQLTPLLESETVLHLQWSREGRLLLLEPAARVRHINMSRWTSWLPAQVLGGYGFAVTRCRGWSVWRRLLFVAASPLIPGLRAWRLVQHHRRRGQPVSALLRAAPAIALGLLADGFGQALGYVCADRLEARMAPGAMAALLARFEFNRINHVRPVERALWQVEAG